MFSIPAAPDVLPSNKNHGLKPSEEPMRMIRKCYLFHKSDMFIISSCSRYCSNYLRGIGYDETQDETRGKCVNNPVMILKHHPYMRFQFSAIHIDLPNDRYHAL
jgi:hypothetical protein